MSTRPAEQFWRQPHGTAWVAHYAASTFVPTRAAMGAALQAVAPFTSALDLGCNCGVLVPWIATASPDCAITGVDLSREALDDANRQWPQQTWIIASIVDWLPTQIGVRTWDVVLSSSCLEHVAPHDIDGVVQAMAQLATRAIVLQEVAITETFAEGVSPTVGVLEWRHDYVRRFDALGWTLAARLLQHAETDRPGAILTFLRKELTA